MDKIQKITKKDSLMFIFGVIFIGICALFIFLGINEEKETDYTNLTHFFDVDKEGVLVYVGATVTPYAVAENESGTEIFAIVSDEKDILYLIKGKVTTLQNLYEDAVGSDVVILKGMSYKTEDNIIDFTIEGYNEYAAEEIIDKDNYANYFGEYYLDLDAVPNTMGFYYFMAFIFLPLGLIFIIISFICKKRTQMVMNSDIYPKVSMEAENPELETKDVIFTKNYIVYNQLGLRIVNYNDITWVYRHTLNYNGIPMHSLAFYVKDDKKVKMISLGGKEVIVDEMINYVKERNPSVLVGYTKENMTINKNERKKTS